MSLAEQLAKRKSTLNKAETKVVQSEDLKLIKEIDGSTSRCRITPITMKKFQSSEWKELPVEKVVNEITSNHKFRILAWNIWIFEEKRDERIQALIDLIRDKKPDFIIFVENTYQAQSTIEQQPFFRENYFTSIVTPQTQQSTYKVSIMSRYPFSTLHLYDLPWTTRKAIVADFNFKTEKNSEFSLTLAGVHLVSEYYQSEQRAEQLAFLHSKLQDKPHFVLGDLNLHRKEEDASFEKLSYMDTWALLKGSKPGFTYGRYRLDRILHKNISLKPKTIRILDNKYANKEAENMISDHKGLLATFVQ